MKTVKKIVEYTLSYKVLTINKNGKEQKLFVVKRDKNAYNYFVAEYVEDFDQLSSEDQYEWLTSIEHYDKFSIITNEKMEEICKLSQQERRGDKDPVYNLSNNVPISKVNDKTIQGHFDRGEIVNTNKQGWHGVFEVYGEKTPWMPSETLGYIRSKLSNHELRWKTTEQKEEIKEVLKSLSYVASVEDESIPYYNAEPWRSHTLIMRVIVNEEARNLVWEYIQKNKLKLDYGEKCCLFRRIIIRDNESITNDLNLYKLNPYTRSYEEREEREREYREREEEY